MGSSSENQDDGYDPVQDETAGGGFFRNGFRKTAEKAADRNTGDADVLRNEFTEREDALFGNFLLD